MKIDFTKLINRKPLYAIEKYTGILCSGSDNKTGNEYSLILKSDRILPSSLTKYAFGGKMKLKVRARLP